MTDQERFDALQKMAEEYKKRKAAEPCPSCGHCPTCGRGGHHTQPLYPVYPQPYYPYAPWYVPPITFTLTSGTSALPGPTGGTYSATGNSLPFNG